MEQRQVAMELNDLLQKKVEAATKNVPNAELMAQTAKCLVDASRHIGKELLIIADTSNTWTTSAPVTSFCLAPVAALRCGGIRSSGMLSSSTYVPLESP